MPSVFKVLAEMCGYNHLADRETGGGGKSPCFWPVGICIHNSDAFVKFFCSALF
jgi:hypothetical protein